MLWAEFSINNKEIIIHIGNELEYCIYPFFSLMIIFNKDIYVFNKQSEKNWILTNKGINKHINDKQNCPYWRFNLFVDMFK